MGKCKDCKWWDFSEKFEDNISIGFCHRYPPSIKIKGEASYLQITTEDDDWCGEFEAKKIKPSPGVHA